LSVKIKIEGILLHKKYNNNGKMSQGIQMATLRPLGKNRNCRIDIIKMNFKEASC